MSHRSAMPDDPPPPAPTARGEYRRYTLAILFVGVGFAALIAIPALLRSSGQTRIIGDVALICFALLPMLVCGFALYAVLLAAIYGINMVERGGRGHLRGVRRRTYRVSQQASETGQQISQRSIEIGTRLSSLDHVFERSDEDKHESNTEQSK